MTSRKNDESFISRRRLLELVLPVPAFAGAAMALMTSGELVEKGMTSIIGQKPPMELSLNGKLGATAFLTVPFAMAHALNWIADGAHENPETKANNPTTGGPAADI